MGFSILPVMLASCASISLRTLRVHLFRVQVLCFPPAGVELCQSIEYLCTCISPGVLVVVVVF
jgi:hypothetical protein